jgi:leucyl aminopeptidase (aminopeptidase T)
VVKGPKNIIRIFRNKKKEAWKKLIDQEQHKSLPQKIINIHKKNFTNIGEFAINTNPKAELCRYLIVNEKIANMVHIALGSGFDPDRSTVYHTDIVINSPRQKLDIYGVSKDGEKFWIHKKGKFVV